MKQKMQTPPAVLCKDLPSEFTLILEYIFGLEPTIEPDYKYIISLFHKVAEDKRIVLDNRFDWDDITLA